MDPENIRQSHKYHYLLCLLVLHCDSFWGLSTLMLLFVIYSIHLLWLLHRWYPNPVKFPRFFHSTGCLRPFNITQEVNIYTAASIHSPDSPSAVSWPVRCKCPGPTSTRPGGLAWSQGPWKWAWPSLSPSWMPVSCRWSPSGHIWGACERPGGEHCSWPPCGCSFPLTAHSTGQKIWAAVSGGSDSSSAAGWKTKEKGDVITQNSLCYQELLIKQLEIFTDETF